MHSSEHGPLVVVYKIDYFVKESLSSSLVLLNIRVVLLSNPKCYDSRLKGLSQETTLVLSNTRELDRVPKTK